MEAICIAIQSPVRSCRILEHEYFFLFQEKMMLAGYSAEHLQGARHPSEECTCSNNS